MEKRISIPGSSLRSYESIVKLAMREQMNKTSTFPPHLIIAQRSPHTAPPLAPSSPAINRMVAYYHESCHTNTSRESVHQKDVRFATTMSTEKMLHWERFDTIQCRRGELLPPLRSLQRFSTCLSQCTMSCRKNWRPCFQHMRMHS